MKRKQFFRNAAMLLALTLPLLTGNSAKAQGGPSCEAAQTISVSTNIAANSTGTNWYKFTPATAGVYMVTAVGNELTGTLSNGSCSNLHPIDKIWWGGSITFYAKAGVTYYFEWANSSEESQIWQFTQPANPAGMVCQTALTATLSASIAANNQGDNWYAFVPAETGTYTAQTTSGMSAAVCTGSCDNLDYINDFVYGSASFKATAGKTYFIHWTNSTGSNQTWSLSKPANTEGLLCETAKAATPASTITANNAGYTWFSFTPNSTQEGVYMIKSNSENYDLLAWVYSGSCNNLNHIVGGITESMFYAEAGTTYYFRWENRSGEANTWSLIKQTNVEGMVCQTAKVITPSDSITTPITNGENWYIFTSTAAQTGVYTANENDLSGLSVYTGVCKELDQFGYSNRFTFYAEAGISYYFKLDNYGDEVKTWSLVKEANPTGMVCQTAKTITPSSAITATITNGYNWYAFTPTSQQEGVYIAQSNEMEISFKEGSCDNEENEHSGGNSGGSSNGYSRTFYAKAGTTYYLGLHNDSDVSQTWSLTKGTGDYTGLFCQTAKAITTSATNITANLGNKSYGEYWYAFTPTETAIYTVSNCGTIISDSYLDIYTGSCGNFKYAAINGSCGEEGQTATFEAQAGTTYYINWYAYFSPEATTHNLIWDLIKETGNTQGMVCGTAITTGVANNIAANRNMTWYKFTPTSTGFYSAIGTDGMLQITVLKDCLLSEENLIAMSGGSYDEDIDAYFWGKATFNAETGKTYYIICRHDNLAQYTWNLSVETNPDYATEVEVDPHTLTLNVNEEKQIEWWVEGGAYTNATWTSRNTNIATVSSGGKITGKAAGQTYVVFSVTAGSTTLKDSCRVTVKAQTIAVTGVSVKHNTTILTGRTEHLSPTISPSNATNQAVSWESRNTAIATVDGTGIVTAVAEGQTYIVVTTVNGGLMDSCLVHVTNTAVSVTGVALNKTQSSLSIGATEQLVVTITPETATNQNISWISSNEAVATVNNAGLVTAISAGQASITVTTEDGNFTAICIITVNPQTDIEDMKTTEKSLFVYPNPVTNGKLVIGLKAQGAGLKANIQLFDLNGKLVGTFAITGEKTDIDISHLSAGMYILQVGNMTTKVVKR